ncbi:MAG: RICIN domain-containing protein [Nostocaceae cyanobacterium]|nr:RICIN domain-containing protein [Nostocaceae cyanobacterium]
MYRRLLPFFLAVSTVGITMPAWGRQIKNVGSQLCVDVAMDASTNNGLADGAPVQQYPCHGGDNQQWTVQLTFAGGIDVEFPDIYKIISQYSNKCLDVPIEAATNYGLADQAQMQQYTCNGGFNQGWIFEQLYAATATTPAIYLIKNQGSGKCLDVPSGTANQVRLQQ